MPLRMAFDRSLRTVDKDGRMRIEVSNISKAQVSPYQGAEIPNSEALGLDPKRIYKLLRDPEELAKAAPSFNALPLLSTHVPVSADDHQPDLVVGATGTDAVFEAPYLKNSLVIWEAVAIAGVKTGQQQELSCAYHYTADMTPGVYDGVQFDGVMRNLIGNHVALVEQGRAGPDVVAADSNPFKGDSMKLTRTALAVSAALGAAIRPKLAADAKMPDLSALIKPVTQKTLKPVALAAAVRAKLAQDIDMSAGELAEVIESATSGVADDDLPAAAAAAASETPAVDADGDAKSKVLAMLKGKVSDADLEAVGACFEATPAAADEDGGDGDAAPTKPAMDAAIAKAKGEAQATFKAIRVAENEVRPLLGNIEPQDSPEAVYKLALDAAKYDCTGVDPSAYRAVFRALPQPGSERKVPVLAADGVNSESAFKQAFPQAVIPRRSF